METPRKFIIAELSIRKLGSSSVLTIRLFEFTRPFLWIKCLDCMLAWFNRAYSGVNSACRQENRQNRHVLCNCSGRGKHKSGYLYLYFFWTIYCNLVNHKTIYLLWKIKVIMMWKVKVQMRKLQLKPGMYFLGHALCAGGSTPHKSTLICTPRRCLALAPPPPPREKKLHNWQKCKSLWTRKSHTSHMVTQPFT